jgi:hypothetical protein
MKRSGIFRVRPLAQQYGRDSAFLGVSEIPNFDFEYKGKGFSKIL